MCVCMHVCMCMRVCGGADIRGREFVHKVCVWGGGGGGGQVCVCVCGGSRSTVKSYLEV